MNGQRRCTLLATEFIEAGNYTNTGAIDPCGRRGNTSTGGVGPVFGFRPALYLH